MYLKSITLNSNSSNLIQLSPYFFIHTPTAYHHWYATGWHAKITHGEITGTLAILFTWKQTKPSIVKLQVDDYHTIVRAFDMEIVRAFDMEMEKSLAICHITIFQIMVAMTSAPIFAIKQTCQQFLSACEGHFFLQTQATRSIVNSLLFCCQNWWLHHGIMAIRLNSAAF